MAYLFKWYNKNSPQRRKERKGIYHFSFVVETPTNENHYASGSRLTNKSCPKGMGLFLFAHLSERE